MIEESPYKKIHNKLTRRIKRLEKYIAIDDEKSRFSLLLLANINIRLNTIFLLLNSSNIDGVFPLIRTLFELNTSLKVYMNSENKEKYLNSYYKKKGYESSVKIERVLKRESNYSVPSKEIEILSELKDHYSKELTEISSKNKRFKPWYEVASGKSLIEICNENNEHEYYFFAYDLMSNWVHPQSVDDNINLEYEQYISVHNEKILYLNLLLCLTSLEDNILLIMNYFKISESNPMFEIGELLSELKIKIRDKYFDLDNKGCVSK